jgi:hypothetical protein
VPGLPPTPPAPPLATLPAEPPPPDRDESILGESILGESIDAPSCEPPPSPLLSVSQRTANKESEHNNANRTAPDESFIIILFSQN